MCIPTAMTDPLTGLDVQAGCQTLDGYQALAYVRTRHQPCDLIPDFARISRQQQFLRAVLNRLLSPSEIAKAPSLIRPVARNLVTTKGFDLADVIYLVKQLEGISTGAVEFRAVPARRRHRGIAVRPVIRIPSRTRSSPASARASRSGTWASISSRRRRPRRTSSCRSSTTTPAGPRTRSSRSCPTPGFDISPGVVDYATYGSDVKGSVIAYKPGHQSDAEVVQKYFPNLQLLEVTDEHVAGEPGRGLHLGELPPASRSAAARPRTDCIAPDA